MSQNKMKVKAISDDDVTSIKWFFIYAGVMLVNIIYIMIFLYITGIYD